MKSEPSKETKDEVVHNKHHGSYVFGAILILIGALVLSKRIFPWIDMTYVFPAILILIGVHLIIHKKACKRCRK